MKKSKMESAIDVKFAIEMMVKDANINSRYLEIAKAKNLPIMENGYFSLILGINQAMFHLGYELEGDGRRADCEDAENIEYMHLKAIER